MRTDCQELFSSEHCIVSLLKSESFTMSFRRAIWVEDQTVLSCTKCRTEFNYSVPKHHCRKCGLIFCHECTRNKCIVPQDELVPRPPNWLSVTLANEDNFRMPQRVCDSCCYQLRDIQEELRQAVSRAHQDTVMSEDSSMPSLPSVDFYLEKEIKKATMMLYSFKNTLGEEKIPRELLDIAKGVVFFTIIKVGFMFTGRYGTGLVVAKLPDGTWSAPSAVQMSGVGWGLQIGAELTDVMLILSTDSAVNAFKSRAQVSVGAELGVSVGPVGRSIESDVTAGNKGAAHAFSYAQSKGLFVGASLEASGIASRPDVNRTFYGEKVSTSALLQGDIPRPRGAEVLYQAINEVLYGAPAASSGSARSDRGSSNVLNQNGHSGSQSNMADSSSYNSNNSSTYSSNGGNLSPTEKATLAASNGSINGNGLPVASPVPGPPVHFQPGNAQAKGQNNNKGPRNTAPSVPPRPPQQATRRPSAPSAPLAENESVDVLL